MKVTLFSTKQTLLFICHHLTASCIPRKSQPSSDGLKGYNLNIHLTLTNGILRDKRQYVEETKIKTVLVLHILSTQYQTRSVRVKKKVFFIKIDAKSR